MKGKMQVSKHTIKPVLLSELQQFERRVWIPASGNNQWCSLGARF